MKKKRLTVYVQPHGNHTDIRGLLGRKVEAILPNEYGGINIRFEGKCGHEPFLEIESGEFTNGRHEVYLLRKHSKGVS